MGQKKPPVETVLQKGHSRYISCLAYSPNGKYMVSGSQDNTLKLWDITNGKEIRTFSIHTGLVRSVMFNPEGTSILTSSADNKALIYNIETGKAESEFLLEKDRLFKSCYSPDGSKVLTMNDRDGAIVWDVNSGEKLGDFKKNYSSSISPQWFSPNGKLILTYTSYQEASLVNINTGIVKQTYACEKPNSFAISPDMKFVAIGTSKIDAFIFDLETGEKLLRLIDDESNKCDGCNTVVTFSPDGKYLATAMRYTGVSIWNVKNGKRLLNFPLPDEQVNNLTFSPEGKYIMATIDDESYVVDIKSGKDVLHLDNDGLECTPVFSPDEKYVLSNNKNNTAALWSINSPERRKNKKIKIYSGYLNRNHEDGLSFKQNNWFHSGIIRDIELKSKVSVSPDGKYIAKGNIDSVAMLFNIETGKVEKIFKGHSKVVLSTAFSNDGKWLLTAGGDWLIKLWDVKTGKEIRTFKGHGELIFDARFSSDNKYIVSGSWDATFRIWETATGKLIKYVDLKNVSPYTITFTPNDLYIVIADLGDNLALWEADACKEFRKIIGHTGLVTSICFSPDGKNMITASTDGKVKVWDMLSGMLINKFSGHTSGVFAAACDPQGTYIASGGNDRTIMLWDPATGYPIKTLTGHSGAITSIQITPDGKKMISGTLDGEIKVWDMEKQKEIYTYIQVDRTNWLIKNPQGYFDGSPGALKLINYVSGLDVITVNSLFEKYYSPNLLKRIQEGELFRDPETSLNVQIKSTPSLKIQLAQENSLSESGLLDSIQWFKNTIPILVSITDQGGGIDELRVYNNSKLIINEHYAGNQRRTGKKQELQLDVPVSAGQNNLSAVALNKDRIESSPANINVYYDGIETDMNLYILSVGINKYENPSYELTYATDDAKAYNRIVQKGARTIFNSVEEYFIQDNDANKAKIEETFQSIANKAQPQDVFIFYFAGHGAMGSASNDETADFFIIPYDVTNIYGDYDLLKEKAISSEEILQLSKQIKAGKQLFILDACQSGGALNALNTRGASREKAVAQLARSTGTFFLLASGAIQFASEARELRHGIFTYAILEALEGKADSGIPDEKITASELKSYVEERVPELTQQYMLTPQYPTGYSFGQDFPIVLVK
jgi:WD40 repeat protein